MEAQSIKTEDALSVCLRPGRHISREVTKPVLKDEDLVWGGLGVGVKEL